MPNGVGFTEQDRDAFNRLQKDVWFGNGLPGLCSRMAEAEGRMDRIEEAQTAINTKFWAIILLLAGAIVTTTTAIVTHALSTVPPAHSSMF